MASRNTWKTRQVARMIQLRPLLHLLRRLLLPFPCQALCHLPWDRCWGMTPGRQPSLWDLSNSSQMQVPFWSQPQGTELWPQACQSQLWPTPLWPLGLAGPPPRRPRGMPSTESNQHSNRRPPGTRHDQDSLVTAVDRRLRVLVGIRAGKATRAVARPPWKQRTAIRFRSGTLKNQVLD